jgi:hypothetical protein
VGALSQYIEERGLPTIGISLLRPHTESMKPPRALWVPFEFGRPLGPPNNAPFQRKILLAALNLLEAPGGPLLEDFPEDAPESPNKNTAPVPPADFSRNFMSSMEEVQMPEALRSEIAAMRPWYDTAVAKRKRTTVGVSGIALDTMADFIYSFVKGEHPENPRKDLPIIYSLKFAIEDLKAYYFEAITSQAGQEELSSKALENWFWDETIAGKVIFDIKKILQTDPDKLTSLFGSHFIVPGEIARRKGSM